MYKDFCGSRGVVANPDHVTVMSSGLARPALQTEGLKKVVVALLEMSDPTVFQHGPYCGLKVKISQAEPL